MSLTGRVALVTGAARRIGRAIACELATAGCDVAVHYRNSREEAEQTVARIESLGRRAILVQQDFQGSADAAGLVRAVQLQFGRLDILVNNAALFERKDGEAAEPEEDFNLTWWETILRINTIIPAALIAAAVPGMRAAGWGRIVNLCDICIDRPWTDHLAYGTSKAGLAYLTRAMARALAPQILVNAVSPGVAAFPEHMPEAQRAGLIERIPLKRSARPEEVATTVRFLVETATYMTGQILSVDGGRTLMG